MTLIQPNIQIKKLNINIILSGVATFTKLNKNLAQSRFYKDGSSKIDLLILLDWKHALLYACSSPIGSRKAKN